MIPWYLTHAVHKDKPWDVQAEAKSRSEDKPRYGYYLEQGLGKTALIVNDFIHYDQVDIMLVLTPQSFKLDWPLAFDEWGVGFIPTGYWPRDPIPFDLEQAAYAVNYEAASRSSAVKPLLELMDKRRVMLVIDEAGATNNPQSGFAKATLELAKRATMVREADGTPLVQNVMDYFIKLKCLGELDGMNPYAFRNRHAKMGGYMGKQIQRDEIREADALYAILDRCSFRALKKDWRADLPPQLDVPVHLEMTTRQRRHYNEMMEDFYTAVQDIDVTAEMVLTQMEKLRQLSSCLAMADGKHHWIEDPKDNPKVLALFDILNGSPGKMVVAYYYKPSGAMLHEVMTKAKLNPARIMGNMQPEEIIEEKRRFNDDPACRVLLGQETATFRGHTLLGSTGNDRCNKMAFFEHMFSWYRRSQIRDRIHRGEQDQPCNYFDLITSPMDEKAIGILQDKRDMSEAVDAIVAAVRSKQWKT